MIENKIVYKLFIYFKYRPSFIILATDGFWDVVKNQEAVDFIKSHLHEQHFGAKSLAVLAYKRGSLDNISVLVVVFKNGRYQFGASR